MLLLTALALADSFVTSVALPTNTPLPAQGPCPAEVKRLATTADAFEHAMVLGACHGYDANPALVRNLRREKGPLHLLDLGWTLAYAATYGAKTAEEANKAVRTAVTQRPDDPKVLLVAALVLAQTAMFVNAPGDFDTPRPATREVVDLYNRAVAAERAHPDANVRAGLRAAQEYMVMYGAFAELSAVVIEP